MPSPKTAADLIHDLVDAYLEVGAVLTGKKLMLQDSDDVLYPGLSHTAGQLAAYAWDGEMSADANAIDEALHEITTAVELIGGSLVLPDGADLFPRERKTELNRLANAATARHHLDAGEPVTIELLAALAGVAEKTLRAATNPNSPNPIAITKEGHWTRIEAAEALVWLSRRPSFKPTHMQSQGHAQPALVDVPALVQTCQLWLAHAELDITALAAHLDWPTMKVQALRALLDHQPAGAFEALGPAALRQFAEAVGMPLPDDFAHQAYRLLALAHADALASAQLGATR